MPNIHFGTALRLMMRAAPLLAVRLGVTLLFWLALLVYLLLAGGLALLIGRASELIGWILFIIAVGAIFPIYNLAYRYVFYMFKAAYIAIIAELLVNDKLPDGINQLEYGKQQVQKRFGETSVMFVVDELVNGVIGAFTRTVSAITSWLPGDTLRQIVMVVNTIIRFSLSYIDEAVLARAFWLKNDSIWTSATDGVVLYAMVWRPILVNAVFLMVLSFIPFIVVLVLLYAPVGLIVSIFSSDAATVGIVALFALAWLFKVAIGDTFAMTAIIVAYQKATEGLEPDPGMKAKLETVSDKFRELKNRAEQELGGLTGKAKNVPPAEPAEPAPASGS